MVYFLLIRSTCYDCIFIEFMDGLGLHITSIILDKKTDLRSKYICYLAPVAVEKEYILSMSILRCNIGNHWDALYEN